MRVRGWGAARHHPSSEVISGPLLRSQEFDGSEIFHSPRPLSIFLRIGAVSRRQLHKLSERRAQAADRQSINQCKLMLFILFPRVPHSGERIGSAGIRLRQIDGQSEYGYGNQAPLYNLRSWSLRVQDAVIRGAGADARGTADQTSARVSLAVGRKRQETNVVAAPTRMLRCRVSISADRAACCVGTTRAHESACGPALSRNHIKRNANPGAQQERRNHQHEIYDRLLHGRNLASPAKCSPRRSNSICFAVIGY